MSTGKQVTSPQRGKSRHHSQVPSGKTCNQSQRRAGKHGYSLFTCKNRKFRLKNWMISAIRFVASHADSSRGSLRVPTPQGTKSGTRDEPLRTYALKTIPNRKLQKIRVVIWSDSISLLFLVCTADLDKLCYGFLSQHVKFYGFMFMYKISTQVVCVNGKHPM